MMVKSNFGIRKINILEGLNIIDNFLGSKIIQLLIKSQTILDINIFLLTNKGKGVILRCNCDSSYQHDYHISRQEPGQ